MDPFWLQKQCRCERLCVRTQQSLQYKNGNVGFGRSGDTLPNWFFVFKQLLAEEFLVFFHRTLSFFYEGRHKLLICAHIFLQYWENKKNYHRRHALFNLLVKLNPQSTAYLSKLTFKIVLDFIYMSHGIILTQNSFLKKVDFFRMWVRTLETRFLTNCAEIVVLGLIWFHH